METTPGAQDEISEVVSGQTVPTLFRSTVAARPDAVALQWLAADGLAAGRLTWAEYADHACRVAAGLADLGVEPGDRVVLMMGNRPEFHVVDVACTLPRPPSRSRPGSSGSTSSSRRWATRESPSRRPAEDRRHG